MRPKLPELSLIELSELVLLVDPEAIFAQLASGGCVVRCPEVGWQSLAGGRESAQCTIQPIRVSGVVSELVIEITRMSNEPHRAWVNGFDLRPGSREKAAWVRRIREIFSQGFEPPSRDEDGVEIYERGAIEQSILFPGSSTEPAHVLMHRRGLIPTG